MMAVDNYPTVDEAQQGLEDNALAQRNLLFAWKRAMAVEYQNPFAAGMDESKRRRLASSERGRFIYEASRLRRQRVLWMKIRNIAERRKF